RSSSATTPSSTSSITAAAVIGFVIDAILTIERGSSSPALSISTSSPRETSAAAPGASPLSTAFSSSPRSSAVIASGDATSARDSSVREPLEGLGEGGAVVAERVDDPDEAAPAVVRDLEVAAAPVREGPCAADQPGGLGPLHELRH